MDIFEYLPFCKRCNLKTRRDTHMVPLTKIIYRVSSTRCCKRFCFIPKNKKVTDLWKSEKNDEKSKIFLRQKKQKNFFSMEKSTKKNFRFFFRRKSKKSKKKIFFENFRFFENFFKFFKIFQNFENFHENSKFLKKLKSRWYIGISDIIYMVVEHIGIGCTATSDTNN